MARVLGCANILSFMAGAKTTGASHAVTTVPRRSLARPEADRARKSAVAGATHTQSASRPRATWRAAPPTAKRSISGPRPVTPSNARGATNRRAAPVSTTSTVAPQSVRSRAIWIDLYEAIPPHTPRTTRLPSHGRPGSNASAARSPAAPGSRASLAGPPGDTARYSVSRRRRLTSRYSTCPEVTASRARVESFFSSPNGRLSRGSMFSSRAYFAATKTPKVFALVVLGDFTRGENSHVSSFGISSATPRPRIREISAVAPASSSRHSFSTRGSHAPLPPPPSAISSTCRTASPRS